MAYKDFTQYNAEAEKIRPSARIQLIQRILNAAQLISSLGAGVPLRWAQSYKGFQVLKYPSGQDPVDVTTQAAISAADSILHEAESQLRSSQEDMNTLASELNAFPMEGSVPWKNLMPSYPDGLKVGLNWSFPTTQGNAITFLQFKSDGSGLDLNPVRVVDSSDWAQFPDTKIYNTMELPLCTMCQLLGSLAVRFKVMRITTSKGISYDVTYLTSGSNYRVLVHNNQTATDTVYVWSQSDLPITPGTTFYPPTGSGSTCWFEGAVPDADSVPLSGHSDNVPESLGLPDPTNLINILDNM